MTIQIRVMDFLSCRKATGSDSTCLTNIDIGEEYANAFRTESYNDFWTRILALDNYISPSYTTVGSTTADRLPSYRLFAEHLLDPDQATVVHILNTAKNYSQNYSILFDYFAKTANASLLCSRLLKDIDHIRKKYCSFKTTIETLLTTKQSPTNHSPIMMTRLTEFSNFDNPFGSTASSPCKIRDVQSGCTNLIQRLELARSEARARLRRVNKIKGGSTVFFVALTATLTTTITILVVTHGLALLAATPTLLAVWLELVSIKKVAKLSAQLDSAAKGTYVLNRDMDTISRLVARVDDELAHMLMMVRFWLARKEAPVQADGEIMRQLRNNKCSFSEQLDELEEHLYLCFMNINRARHLVIKEIIDPVKSVNVDSNL